MNNEKLNAALFYEAGGWSIIPVGENKRPLIKSWAEFQKERASEEQIKEWWAAWPDANPAVVTGKISKLVVLDIDTKHNRTSGEFDIPLTVCSKTGSGGEHIFFKYPGNYTKSTNGQLFGEGIDIKADGGYIILPPSKNQVGFYEWVVPPEEEELADIPDWLVRAFVKSTNSGEKLWQQGMSGVGEGLRNETAASIAGKIITSTSPELLATVGWNQFMVWNQSNTPPLNEAELLMVWNSVLTRHNSSRIDLPTRNVGLEDYKKRIASNKDSKAVAYSVAQYLCHSHNIKTPDNKSREIFAYRDGYYRESENFIKKEIQEILGKKLNRSLRGEIIEHIKDLSLVDEKSLLVDKNYINLRNGIYSIRDKKLLGHSPKYFFTWQLPLAYEENAECAETIKALRVVLSQSDIDLIQEWFGYCLYRDYGLKKAVIFVGEQNTGKTTVLKLCESLVGRENIAGVSLEQLTSNTFALAHLRDKFINIYDDLSYKDVNDNGIFKMVTGNGTITGEFKYGHQFQFQNFAKLTFSCNKIPNVKDTNDEAYFNRWMIIEFNRPIERPDPRLFEKINTDTELSGLLNFALAGLDRVNENKQFSYRKSEDEIKEQMQKSGSPVAQFAYDCLEEYPSGTVTKDQMIECFRIYAKKHNLPSMTKETLGKKLPKYAPFIDSGREGSRNNQISVWQNARIKKGAFPEFESDNF